MKFHSTRFNDFASSIHGFKAQTHDKMINVCEKTKEIEQKYNKLQLLDQFKNIKEDMHKKVYCEYEDIKNEINEMQQNLQDKKLQYVKSHSIVNNSTVKDKKEMARDLNHSLASLEASIRKKKAEMSKVEERLTELIHK